MPLGTDFGRSNFGMPDPVPGGARRHPGSGRGDVAGGLPVPREEIPDPPGGMIGQPRQHVGEPGLRVDPVQLAGDLPGIPCTGGHDGSEGAPTCRDAKSPVFLTRSSTSCWRGPTPRRPSPPTASPAARRKPRPRGRRNPGTTTTPPATAAPPTPPTPT